MTFSLGAWPYGVSPLEWLGICDGDGKVRALSPRAQSDADPPYLPTIRLDWRSLSILASQNASRVAQGQAISPGPIRSGAISRALNLDYVPY